MTVDAFRDESPRQPNPKAFSYLDLHKICGEYSSGDNSFKKLKNVLGLGKDTLKNRPYYDLFFNRTRTHFDQQDSEKILEFVEEMNLEEETRFRRSSPRKRHSNRHHRNTEKSKTRRPSSKKLRNVLDKLDRGSKDGDKSNLFWPWHVHIRSYQTEKTAECSGILLGCGSRLLNIIIKYLLLNISLNINQQNVTASNTARQRNSET